MALKPEQYFWLANGRPVKSLGELSAVLAGIPQSVYDHHVNADKNDFSSWISGVFKGEKLASEIKEAKTPKEMKTILDNFLHPKKAIDLKKPEPEKLSEPVKEEIKKVEEIKKIKPVKKKVSKKKIVKNSRTTIKSVRKSVNPVKKQKVKKKSEILNPTKKIIENNFVEDGHSVIYEELLKDKWSKEPENKYFYRALVKYGVLEFLFGIAVGAFLVLVLKGLI